MQFPIKRAFFPSTPERGRFSGRRFNRFARVAAAALKSSHDVGGSSRLARDTKRRRERSIAIRSGHGRRTIGGLKRRALRLGGAINRAAGETGPKKRGRPGAFSRSRAVRDSRGRTTRHVRERREKTVTSTLSAAVTRNSTRPLGGGGAQLRARDKRKEEQKHLSKYAARRTLSRDAISPIFGTCLFVRAGCRSNARRGKVNFE